MKVKDIMTTDVKTVSSKSTIQDAARIMAANSIGCLIVVDKAMLAGIITERDIMRDVVSQDKTPSKTLVKSVMRKEVVVIEPDAEIEDAAEAMTEKQVKRLPVVKDSHLVGIISSVDIVAAEPKMMDQIAKLVLFRTKKKRAAG
jgi:CBS domain-containing protein